MLEVRIQNLLTRDSRKPLQRRDIADMLNLHGGERKQLTAVLRKLVAAGAITHKKGFYRLSQRETFQGVFSKTEQGYGFVRPEMEGRGDLFVAAKDVCSAMSGDVVVAEKHGFDRSGRPYGRIVRVLQRARQSILGIYREQKGGRWVAPLDAGIGNAVFVSQADGVTAKPGQLVELEFSRYPDANSAGSGKIVEVLGDQNDPLVDIEAVIIEHALPRHFSAVALAEAERVAVEIEAEELRRRADLRSLPLMTIDGETAKDFDDAVAARREPEGFRLWVCIADVAHYVAVGGVLDQEACERGTSVYFPGFCLPMLPEVLSNGSCSLNPGVDRLVMTAELLIDNDGHCRDTSFYPAVIRSRARLTYTEVSGFLENAASGTMPLDVAEQLPVMVELSELLGRIRKQRGSLELDVPDAQIVLDDSGFPISVVRSERTIAHCLIEEFMLVANEAVAVFLEGAERRFLYRIHEPPTLEKLQDFQQLAAESGIGLVLGVNLQQNLQHLLDAIADKPEARLLNQQLLRSLQQARYTPENKGHFGLAAQCYCHFTSPIRRYPDLVVHRVLKSLLQRDSQKNLSLELLSELGRKCSDRERRAMAAERQLFEMRRCQLLQHRLGETFPGVIISVTEFGFFVELDELLIEGLVHVRSLAGDYYSFDPLGHVLRGERRRKEFRVGMPVTIRVDHVDVWRRRIDFTLVGS